LEDDLMYLDENFLNILMNNLRKLFYPEEWINIDMSISKSELFTMLLVDQNREIIMSQIADYINVPMSTATGIVDRLVKNGYLKRERSDSDRRVVVIMLTEKGKNLVNELKALIFKYINLINDELTDEERQLIFKLFNKIINILSRRDDQRETDEQKSTIKKIEIE
jgi:DNA-binding MarR family transcriptional regulator